MPINVQKKKTISSVNDCKPFTQLFILSWLSWLQTQLDISLFCRTTGPNPLFYLSKRGFVSCALMFRVQSLHVWLVFSLKQPPERREEIKTHTDCLLASVCHSLVGFIEQTKVVKFQFWNCNICSQAIKASVSPLLIVNCVCVSQLRC